MEKGHDRNSGSRHGALPLLSGPLTENICDLAPPQPWVLMNFKKLEALRSSSACWNNGTLAQETWGRKSGWNFKPQPKGIWDITVWSSVSTWQDILLQGQMHHAGFSNNWYLMHNILMNLTSTNTINWFSMKYNFSNNLKTLWYWKLSQHFWEITRGFFLFWHLPQGFLILVANAWKKSVLLNGICSVDKSRNVSKGWRPHYTQYPNLCIFKTHALQIFY